GARHSSHRRADSAAEAGSVVRPARLAEETGGGLHATDGAGEAEAIKKNTTDAASPDFSVSAGAGQSGRRGVPRAADRSTNRDQNPEDATPSSARERPPPSPHRPPPSPLRPRGGINGGGFVAFVGGSFRGAVERSMSEDKDCPAPANARPRSGGRGMRSLSRGSSSSAIHHVRRNSTGAHATGFDGGRPMVRANSSTSSDNLRSLQLPEIADRSPSSPFEALEKAERSPCSSSPHGIRAAAEAATVSGSFSFYNGGSGSSSSGKRGGSSPLWSLNNSSGGGNSSSGGGAGGWGVGSIFRSLHAPVSPIFRPKRPSVSPWDHPTTSPVTAPCASATPSSDAGSNGAGATANKPPKHHLWTANILPAARPHRIKSLNSFPSSTALNQMPQRAFTPMRVPACPSVPEPSPGVPPLLRRSRTEGTCETESLDYAITPNDDSAALNLGGAMTHGAAPHAARQGSKEPFQDSGRASRAASQGPFKNSGRHRTLRGDSCRSFSEGCIPIVPDTVGSLVTTRSKGSAPHFVPASEHRLFSGLDNDPPRFHRSSMSFSQLPHPWTQGEVVMEMRVQAEPARELPVHKLENDNGPRPFHRSSMSFSQLQHLSTEMLVRSETAEELPVQTLSAQQVRTEELPTQQLTTQHLPTQQLPTQQLPTQQLPTQQLPVQKVAAAAEVAGAGKATVHASAASKCNLPSLPSPGIMETGRQELKQNQPPTHAAANTWQTHASCGFRAWLLGGLSRRSRRGSGEEE
ncbi:unnamed protein product, partial [Closterium sp. NIES-53]